MRIRPIQAVLGAFAAVVLAASAAHGFTVENKDGANGYASQFDLGEQAKQFRKDGTDAAPSLGKRDFTTPLGAGTLELGVRQGPSSNFGLGSSLGSSYGGFASRARRQDFERVLTPENLR